MLRQQFLSENIPTQYNQEEYNDMIDILKNNFQTSLNDVLTIISDLINGKLCQEETKKFIILTGPYNSGKTTILNTIKSIFKQYDISLSFVYKNIIPKLKNKLLVTINEFNGDGRVKDIINDLTKSKTIIGRELFKNSEEVDITEMNLLICMQDIEYNNFPFKENAITIRCENNIHVCNPYLYAHAGELGNKLYSYILFKNKQHQETLMTWLLVSRRLSLYKDIRLLIRQYIKTQLTYC